MLLLIRLRYCGTQYSQSWFAPIGSGDSASLSAALDACCTDSFSLARCDLQPVTLPCDLPEAAEALRTCDAERIAELAEVALRVRRKAVGAPNGAPWRCRSSRRAGVLHGWKRCFGEGHRS